MSFHQDMFDAGGARAMANLKKALVLLVLGGAAAGGAFAHEEGSRIGNPEQLGEVVFSVSCNPAAQQEFNR